jgi:spermidine synthase
MSIFLEKRPNGGEALYIDGDLQFDTSDEALYHEALALPALCIARKHFESRPLSVLICGGGDALALREALRFPNVQKVDLVDYSQEIVNLARTELAFLNQSALSDPRVSVSIEDAWEHLALHSKSANYDVILCDFTVPRRHEDSRVYSREWFSLLQEKLHPDGIIAINSFSPQGTPEAFWSLQKTIRAASLKSIPYRVCIPSFHNMGYGIWSFSLCARSIRLHELRDMNCPVELRQANLTDLWRGAIFPPSERAQRRCQPINTLECDTLLPMLLNPGLSTVQLPKFDDVSSDASFDLEPLIRSIPILHPYHTRLMIDTLARQVSSAIKKIDLRMLVDALLKRAAELPKRLCVELYKLKEYLRDHFDPLGDWETWSYRLFAALVIIITVANSIAPDSAFAKGGFGGGHGGFSTGIGEGHGFGSFGRVGDFGAPHAPGDISSARITSSGFRARSASNMVEDVEGRQYPTRTYYYRPLRGYEQNSGYQDYSSNIGAPNPPPQDEHQAVFAANSDMVVLENGDIVVNLSQTTYLLVSGGHVALMTKGSDAPLALVYHDPNLRNSLLSDISAQKQALSLEINTRKEWLSWVDWTGALIQSVRNDETEYENLIKTMRRLDDALNNLDSLQSSTALPPIPQRSGIVDLFAGGRLGTNGVLSIRTEANQWLNTDGSRMWLNNSENATQIPALFKGALASIITKRITENNADIADDANGIRELNSELASLKSDLAQYQNIYYQNNDPSYEVDYGTDEIGVSDAINRTQADIANCGDELKKTSNDSDNLRSELATLRWVQVRFEPKK